MNEVHKTDQWTNEVAERVADEQDKITHLMWELNDTNDIWEGGQKNINAKIENKAKEMGISKEAMSKYKFKEFNFKIEGCDDKKKSCFLCKKNLKCEKHKFVRKRSLNNSDFERA